MLYVIKIGGSVLTDKRVYYRLSDLERLRGLFKLLAERHRRGDRMILVHGGGSFAHQPVCAYGLHRSRIVDKSQAFGIALTRLLLTDLQRRVAESLLREGLPVYIMHTGDVVTVRGGEIRLDVERIRDLVSQGLVPLLHGDLVVLKDGVHVVSGDLIAEILARDLRPDAAIFLLDVEGVYEDLRTRRLIRRVDGSVVDRIRSSLRTSSIDVTGGILGKLEACLRIARLGIKVYLCSAYDVESVRRALDGREPERCTIVTY